MNKQIYFRHMVTTDNRRFTIAGMYASSFDDVIIGVSLCGAKENFCRLDGRNRSAGRINATSRGKTRVSLYENTMPENYWHGQEAKVFHQIATRFEKMSSTELKREFRL